MKGVYGHSYAVSLLLWSHPSVGVVSGNRSVKLINGISSHLQHLAFLRISVSSWSSFPVFSVCICYLPSVRLAWVKEASVWTPSWTVSTYFRWAQIILKLSRNSDRESCKPLRVLSSASDINVCSNLEKTKPIGANCSCTSQYLLK